VKICCVRPRIGRIKGSGWLETCSVTSARNTIRGTMARVVSVEPTTVRLVSRLRSLSSASMSAVITVLHEAKGVRRRIWRESSILERYESSTVSTLGINHIENLVAVVVSAIAFVVGGMSGGDKSGCSFRRISYGCGSGSGCIDALACACSYSRH
jgi:hypothetical protein